MARSHGMGPKEHQILAFDEDLERLGQDQDQDQRSAFLLGKVNDFFQRAEYRGLEPLDRSDLAIALHAAQTWLTDLRDEGATLTPSQKYLIEKFIGHANEVAEKLGEPIPTEKIDVLIRKLDEPRPAEVLPDSSPEEDPTTQRGPNFPTSLERRILPVSSSTNNADFAIAIPTSANAPIKLLPNIFLAKRCDGPYEGKLKELGKRIFSFSGPKEIIRELTSLVEKFSEPNRTQDQIFSDLQSVLRSGIDQLAKIVENPSSATGNDIFDQNTRKVAIGHVVSALRTAGKLPVDISDVCPEGSAAFEYFSSEEFTKVAMQQLQVLLYNPTEENIDLAWNARKIAKHVGNRDLETLAAIAYAYYHGTEPSRVPMKTKIVDGLTADSVEQIPDSLLDLPAYRDKSWRQLAKVAVPTASRFLRIQGTDR